MLFFYCYVKRFSTSVAIRVHSLSIFYSSWKTKTTLPYIHVAYYSRSFRSLSVCWVLNKRAPLPNFVFFPAQNWPSNWSYTNFNYFPSTFVEKEKENLSDNGDQFTWNLSIVYRSTYHMLVTSKLKTRQWKQVLYFLVYNYLCDRMELINTFAALLLIAKKPEVGSIFLLMYNLLPNILDEYLTVRKNSCPFNLFLSRERMTFACMCETFCSCARYLSLECTWLFARACIGFCSRARYFPLVLQLIYSHYELN